MMFPEQGLNKVAPLSRPLIDKISVTIQRSYGAPCVYEH